MTPTPGSVADALEGLGIDPRSLPVLAASGWESHVFRCETTVGTLAIRVLAGGATTRAQREAEIMQALWNLDYPVPAVHATTTVADRPALVMDFIEGTTLERSGWPNERILETCVGLMNQLHALAAPPPGDSADWLRTGTNLASQHLPRFTPYIEAFWSRELPKFSAAYCHLDFHPGNVLWNGAPWVIDWTSGRITDPRFDFAWTRLLAAMYEPEALGLLPAVEEWFETAMALRRLLTVAEMLEDGIHAAGDDFSDQLGVMRVPADWLERGTGIPVADVEALLRG